MERLARARMAALLLLLALLALVQGAQWKREQEVLLRSAQNSATPNSVTEYVNREHGFAISFPKTWNFTVQPSPGGEVRFTLAFTAGEPGVHGLVQVWKIPDLKQFIEQSLITAPSLEDVGVRSYRLQGMDGYLLTYRQRIPGGKMMIHDVLAGKPDHTVYRIVYMVPEALAGSEQTEIFHRLLSSFRLL